jgi:hypothetical protein
MALPPGPGPAPVRPDGGPSSPGPIDRPQPAQAGPSLGEGEHLEDVPHPVGPAALELGPRECLGDRRGDPAGPVGGHELDPLRIEAPLNERAQEDPPRRGRLRGRLAVVEQLAPTGRIDPVRREDHPLRCSPAPVADRDPETVAEQVAGLERDRPRVVRGDPRVERPAEPADRARAERDAGEPLGEPGGLAGREPPQERLAQQAVDACRPARRPLEEGGSVRDEPPARDVELGRPELGDEEALIDPVAVIDPLARALVAPGEDQRGQLVLHRRLEDRPDAVEELGAQIPPQRVLVADLSPALGLGSLGQRRYRCHRRTPSVLEHRKLYAHSLRFPTRDATSLPPWWWWPWMVAV